ncbi:MAG TPA: GNAT family N-acetyltransferase [Rhodanobacteraceae bacterium]|nr:GNAT family N-acetyltransferase [Rhodanobacteraceae bacterium]
MLPSPASEVIAMTQSTPSPQSILPEEALTVLHAPNDVPQWEETLRDGSRVLIRALRRSDAELERAFIKRLSPESRRMRFLAQISEPSDALIRSLTDLDEDDLAFVALVHREGEKREVGVSRYSMLADGTSCECAVTVDDEWRNKGLGTALMRHLMEIARRRGMRSMVSTDAAENYRMRELARDLGFTCRTDPEDPTQVIYRLEL